MSETNTESTGPTLIEADFSTTPLEYKPMNQGVRKVRIVSAAIVDNAKKDGKNLLTIMEAMDGDEQKQIRSYIGTTNKTALLRAWMSAGLDRPEPGKGMDITQLVGRDAVIFVQNEFQPDPINIGQQIERSNLKQFLVQTDQAYATAT